MGDKSLLRPFGINKEMQFLGNDLNVCCQYDFLLDMDLSQIPGSIRATQGALNSPAANCFTSFNPQDPDIVANPTETATFKYYYQGGEHPIGCPVNPHTPGNYTKQIVQELASVIDCDQFGGLPHGVLNPSLADLNTRRTTLQQLAPSIATNENALNLYYQTLQEKDAILRYLLEQAITSGLYSTALDCWLANSPKPLTGLFLGCAWKGKIILMQPIC